MSSMELLGENLTFRYYEQSRKNSLEQVSFAVEQGSVTVLVGKSGCGKSTLAAVLAGLYPENGGVLTGKALVAGKPVGELPPNVRAGLVTMLFQNCDLQFCMNTLRDELRFCLENCSVLPQEMDARVAEAAEKSGTTALLDRTLQTLSGGEKQRAALCCVLALGAPCLILDEPFANLDPAAADELTVLLVKLCRAQGLTILAIDHQLGRWLPYADEIVLLGKQGKVLAQGIHRENLAEFAELLQKNGVALPGEQPRVYPVRAGGETVLELRQVTVAQAGSARSLLVEDAELVVKAGSMTAIMGKSGSGKTTLFRALLGQLPHEGEILLQGQPLGKQKKQLSAKIGMVFQNPANQFVSQRVVDEVLFSLRLWQKGKPESWYNTEAERLLELFRLGEYRHYSPFMLSQGQQRRLAVLAMLAGGQQLLLLDEPTYGQDAHSVTAMMELLAQRVAQGLTVIFSTHDEALARRWADSSYTLQNKCLLPAEEGALK